MHPIPRSFAFLLPLAALLFFTVTLPASASELIDLGSGAGGSDLSLVEEGNPPPTDPSEPVTEPPTEPPTTPPTPPAVEAKFRITITAPDDWYTKTADVIVGLEDLADTGFTLAEVKAGQDGKWIDVTDGLADDGKAKFEISDNVTVYVAVTDHTEKAHVKSLYVECFDRDAPTVKASIEGKSLRAEAEDALSGVAAIFVSGYEFDDLRDGALDIRVREYADTDEEDIFVYAVDGAGSKSKTVTVKNPYYEEENEERDQRPAPTAPTVPAPTTPPATQPTAPVPTTPAPPVTAPAEEPTEPREPNPLTPDGTGSVVDAAGEEDGKDFFTITTADENTFYLVVDHQRDSEGVYLLDNVTENDLLSLAEPSPEAPTESIPTVPPTEPVIPTEPEPETEPETEAETEPAPAPAKPGSNTGGIILIAAALAAGGAGYYFKIVKPRRDAALSSDEEEDEGEDLDDDGVYGGYADERGDADDYRFGSEDEQNGGGGA